MTAFPAADNGQKRQNAGQNRQTVPCPDLSRFRYKPVQITVQIPKTGCFSLTFFVLCCIVKSGSSERLQGRYENDI
jgi:hypothetical protein